MRCLLSCPNFTPDPKSISISLLPPTSRLSSRYYPTRVCHADFVASATSKIVCNYLSNFASHLGKCVKLSASGMSDRIDVFISHADEDRDSCALPLYHELNRRGMRVFLDSPQLHEGSHAPKALVHAIQNARVAVLILSPEYAFKKWPIRELRCFLQRAEDEDCPALIPVYYRLSLQECKRRLVFQKYPMGKFLAQFVERVDSGEISTEAVLDALEDLVEIPGIDSRNPLYDKKVGVKLKKRKFIEEIGARVELELGDSWGVLESSRLNRNNVDRDKFTPSFHVPLNASEIMLDLLSTDENGKPSTPEGQFRKELMQEDIGGQRVRIIAIKGPAGAGKSCLLRGIASLEEVKNCFPGGVYYIQLGMEATEDTLISGLARVTRESGGAALAESIQNERSLFYAIQVVREWFERQKCLLLLDDVWEEDGVGAKAVMQLLRLFDDASSSVIALSTRFDSVTSIGIVISLEPKGVYSEEAMSMLLNHANFRGEDLQDPDVVEAFKEMLERCSGLPLFLAAMGRAVFELALHYMPNERLAWGKYLSMLARTSKICFQMSVGIQKDLLTTFSASIMVLEQRHQGKMGFKLELSFFEMHRCLSVLAKHAVAPLSMLRRLWRVRTNDEVAMIVTAFVDVGLAEFEVGQDGLLKGLTLHDLVHEFAVICAQSKDEYSMWHQKILDVYLDEKVGDDGCRPWWLLEDDSYIFANVCRHLAEAGCIKELLCLLQSANWTELRLQQGSLAAWCSDFEQCSSAISGDDDGMDIIRSGLRLIQECVADNWHVLVRNKQELAYQAHAHLLDIDERLWPVRNYLESVRERQPKPWLRPRWRYYDKPDQFRMMSQMALKYRVYDVALNSSLTFAAIAAGQYVLFVNLQEMKVEKTFTMSNGIVLSVASTPDCETTVTGSNDGTLRLWSRNTGIQIGSTMRGHKGPVWSVAVSGNGERIVSGSWDSTVRIWDVKRGTQVGNVMRGHEQAVCAVAISRDGKTIVSGGADNSVRMWDASSGNQIGEAMTGHEGPVWSVAFRSNGQVVSGSSDGSVRIWTESGEQYGEALQEKGAVWSISVSDGGRILCGGSDEKVHLMDLAVDESIAEAMLGHSAPVCSVTLSADGGRAVSAALNGSLRVWDVSRETSIECIRRHQGAVCSVAISPKGKKVASADFDGTIRVWDASIGTQLTPAMGGYPGEIESVALSSSGDFVVAGATNNSIRVWNTTTGDLLGEVRTDHECGVAQLDVTEENNVVSCGFAQDRLRWKLDPEVGLVPLNETRHEDGPSSSDSNNSVPTLSEPSQKGILCWHRSVVLDDGNTLLATLPAAVNSRSWCFDAVQRTLTVGLSNGQVVVHSLVE